MRWVPRPDTGGSAAFGSDEEAVSLHVQFPASTDTAACPSPRRSIRPGGRRSADCHGHHTGVVAVGVGVARVSLEGSQDEATSW